MIFNVWFALAKEIIMLSKIFLKCATFVILTGLIIFPGCEGDQGPAGPIGPIGPTGPQGETIEVEPFFVGYMAAPRHDINQDDVFGTVNISIINIPSIPDLSINGTPLSTRPSSNLGTLNYTLDAFPINAGDSAHLLASYSKSDNSSALASADILMPGYFDIIASSQDISRNDTVRMDWSPSTGSDGYFVSLSTSVTYVDTAAQKKRMVFDMDTVVADTFFEITATGFFPDSGEVFSYDISSALLTVDALNGPIFEDNAGNVFGDGFGFFYGINFGHAVDFSLDTGSRRSAIYINRVDRFRAFIGKHLTQSK
jgi:hypothetical protein